MSVIFDAQVVSFNRSYAEVISYVDHSLHVVRNVLGMKDIFDEVEKRFGMTNLRRRGIGIGGLFLEPVLPNQCVMSGEELLNLRFTQSGTIVEAAYLGASKVSRFIFLPKNVKYTRNLGWYSTSGSFHAWYGYYMDKGYVKLRLLRLADLATVISFREDGVVFLDKHFEPYMNFKEVLDRSWNSDGD